MNNSVAEENISANPVYLKMGLRMLCECVLKSENYDGAYMVAPDGHKITLLTVVAYVQGLADNI